MSYRPMFEFAKNEIAGNAQRFATHDEALKSAQACFMVWMMPKGYLVEESDEAVNYRWDDAEGDVRL